MLAAEEEEEEEEGAGAGATPGQKDPVGRGIELLCRAIASCSTGRT